METWSFHLIPAFSSTDKIEKRHRRGTWTQLRNISVIDASESILNWTQLDQRFSTSWLQVPAEEFFLIHCPDQIKCRSLIVPAVYYVSLLRNRALIPTSWLQVPAEEIFLIHCTDQIKCRYTMFLYSNIELWYQMDEVFAWISVQTVILLTKFTNWNLIQVGICTFWSFKNISSPGKKVPAVEKHWIRRPHNDMTIWVQFVDDNLKEFISELNFEVQNFTGQFRFNNKQKDNKSKEGY